MAKFAVFLKGAGEGCDYTIACNQKLVVLKATTLAQAEKEVAKILDDHGADSDEHSLDHVTIFEGEQHEFDYAGWCQKRADAETAETEKAAKKSRREQFKKLKEEFKDEGDDEEE